MKHLLVDVVRSRFVQLQRIGGRADNGPKSWRVVGALIGRTGAKITDGSRANLENLAKLHPRETGELLARLRQTSGKIESIIVPAGLSREGLSFSFNKGVVRFRNDRSRGQKEILGYRPRLLAEFVSILDQEKNNFASDPEYAALFLYKIVLRTRLELYKAGEERSAVKKLGLPVAAVPFQEIIELLSYFRDNFPFNIERDKESLARAVACLSGRGNNVAADTILQYLTERLVKRLGEQMVERLRRVRPAQGWKITSSKEGGGWVINQVGYRQTAGGVLRRESIPHRVSTAKLLSMIDHELEKISQEQEENESHMERIKRIESDPLGYWSELLDLHERFDSFFAWHKDKACVELETALHVTLVGSDQAIRLAQSMLGVARETLLKRQDVLRSQAARMQKVKEGAEKMLVDKLMRFALSIVDDLADPRSLTDPIWLGRIDRRLGGFLGTFLREEMREPWLKGSKSRIYGLKRALPKLSDQSLTGAQKAEKLKKGALFILQIGFFYENRDGRATNALAWQSYISRYQSLIGKFDELYVSASLRS